MPGHRTSTCTRSKTAAENRHLVSDYNVDEHPQALEKARIAARTAPDGHSLEFAGVDLKKGGPNTRKNFMVRRKRQARKKAAKAREQESKLAQGAQSMVKGVKTSEVEEHNTEQATDDDDSDDHEDAAELDPGN